MRTGRYSCCKAEEKWEGEEEKELEKEEGGGGEKN
jgi:hypothetical protein